MTMFFVSISCVLPSSPVTATLPAATILPVPRKTSILFFLNRKATPLTFGVDRRVLVRQHLLQVELRLADLDAERVEGVAGLVEHLGGVQQRLGRDAADIEAGAAKRRALLDHGDLQAELGGLDGADIAARAGSDDDDIISHFSILPYRRSAADGPQPCISMAFARRKATREPFIPGNPSMRKHPKAILENPGAP